MVVMTTPVPQSPSGGAEPHTQVQCTEQQLPSKESSSSADDTGNATLVQDIAKVSTSGEMDSLFAWHHLADVNRYELQTPLTKMR